MNDVKIKVIDSDKLINAINEGSYDVNLSAAMALGAVTFAQPETCAYWDRESNFCALHRPSAQPKRMRGKWIKMSDVDGDYYVCDQCGEELPSYTTESPTWDNPYPPKYSIDKTNFCPNCGADMRGES